MGGRSSSSAAAFDANRQLNVVMFGLNRAGKTQLTYTGLVGNDTMETYQKQEAKHFKGIEASQGFNSELFVRKNESFMLWDISGDLYHRQFWGNYLKQIPATIILYVVNTNEPIERLHESKMYLHSLLLET